jgi:transposase
MGKSITDLSSVTTVGLDLAKHVFQVHAIGAFGRVIVAKALRRKDVLFFFAQLPKCLVGMEACGSAHHWARELIKLGHDARMMPPAYVKPYVRRQKNDAADAAGICEAVTRPSMRFVGVRTLENQAALMHHKAREMLVAQRTQLINALRGHLAEMGVIAAQGLKNARELARLILAEGDETIPACVRMALVPLVRQLHVLDQEIACRHRTIAAMARDDEMARRLMTIPGLGTVGFGDGLECSGYLRFLRPARVRRLSWPDSETTLVRRQGTVGPRLEDGQSVFAKIARRGRACGPLSSQAARRRAAILGKETHADQALQACRRRARQ